MSTADFLSLLPPHECTVYLTHNEHKSYYQTVAESIAASDHNYTSDCWVSEEQKRLAIETNDCWTIQYYPHSPVTFHNFAAHTLEALLEGVAKLQGTP